MSLTPEQWADHLSYLDTPMTDPPECFNPPTMPRSLVTSNRNAYRAWAQDCLERGEPVVFDFTHCVYVDSAACGMLVSLAKLAERRGTTFRCAHVHGDVEALFALTHIAPLVTPPEPRAA